MKPKIKLLQQKTQRWKNLYRTKKWLKAVVLREKVQAGIKSFQIKR